MASFQIQLTCLSDIIVGLFFKKAETGPFKSSEIVQQIKMYKIVLFKEILENKIIIMGS